MTNDAAQNMLAAYEAMAAPVRLSEKLWLSLPEAAWLAGTPADKLGAVVRAGKLKAHEGVGRGVGQVQRGELEASIKQLLVSVFFGAIRFLTDFRRELPQVCNRQLVLFELR